MYSPVASTDEIAPGGMKQYEVKGQEIVILNNDGTFLAFDRRCGHMNAPLDMGTADGFVVTCPLHFVRFDARTGEAVSRNVPLDFGEKLPPKTQRHRKYTSMINSHIRICNIKIYKVKVEGGRIFVDV